MSEENFDINDLTGEQKAIAEVIGMEAYIKLAKVYGGCDSIYIAKIDKLQNAKRNKKIVSEFNGYNYQTLAEKYGLSTRMIREIINDYQKNGLPGQISLFDE